MERRRWWAFFCFFRVHVGASMDLSLVRGAIRRNVGWFVGREAVLSLHLDCACLFLFFTVVLHSCSLDICWYM